MRKSACCSSKSSFPLPRNRGLQVSTGEFTVVDREATVATRSEALFVARMSSDAKSSARLDAIHRDMARIVRMTLSTG